MEPCLGERPGMPVSANGVGVRRRGSRASGLAVKRLLCVVVDPCSL